jgi:hypothetical protein
MDHPKPCTQKFTNLLSNTNLFSAAEQEKIRQVVLKYQNVTTNSGPAGSFFQGWQFRRMRYTDLGVPTNYITVACFNYTNHQAKEEVYAYSGSRYIMAKFRKQNGDGYNVCFADNVLMQYQEFKNFLPDGLFVVVQDPKREHCGMWTRFDRGMAVGRIISWQRKDERQDVFEIGSEAEFKEPFNYLKYQSVPIDFGWDEISN